MPRVPSGASGRAGEDQVDDLVGQVVLAIGDEDLGAGDPPAAVAVRLGAGLERADVAARLRLGQVHRRRPFAADDLGQIVALAARREPCCSSASTAPERQHRAQREADVGGVRDPPSAPPPARSGSPCPPCSRRRRPASHPAALDEGRDRPRLKPGGMVTPPSSSARRPRRRSGSSGANSPSANCRRALERPHRPCRASAHWPSSPMPTTWSSTKRWSRRAAIAHGGPLHVARWTAAIARRRWRANQHPRPAVRRRGDRRSGAADRSPASRSRCRPRPSTASPPTPPMREAVARIYAAKGRPSFNPLIVHVPDLGKRPNDRRVRRAGDGRWPSAIGRGR